MCNRSARTSCPTRDISHLFVWRLAAFFKGLEAVRRASGDRFVIRVCGIHAWCICVSMCLCIYVIMHMSIQACGQDGDESREFEVALRVYSEHQIRHDIG